MKWTLQPSQKMENEEGKWVPVDPDNRFIFVAPRKFARGCTDPAGYRIEATYHFNGSGKKAFGGAVKWPAAKLVVDFEEGHEQERDRFIHALQKFLDEYKDI